MLAAERLGGEFRVWGCNQTNTEPQNGPNKDDCSFSTDLLGGVHVGLGEGP